MATFTQQTQRRFGTYTPEVNEEVYAKALAKKDEEYKIGTQKVQSYRDSVAGIPVAFNHEREYLQGVTNQLTSKINEMVGANWSDQKLQNSIANYSSAIYNDENVQTAIANASHVRDQYGKLRDDDKVSKGANIANKYDYLKSLNEFSNNAKVGDSFSSSYSQFVDANAKISDYFSKKHPDQKIDVEQAGVGPDGTPLVKYNAYQWDAVKQTWKGIKKDDVESEIKNMISTSPEIEHQLAINAQYSTKDYTPETYYTNALQLQTKVVQNNSRLIDDYVKELLSVNQGSDEYKKLSEKVNDLKLDNLRRVQYVNNDLVKETSRYASDPDFKKSANNKMYMDNWLNSQGELYSWGEENVEFQGESPYKKWLDKQKQDLDVQQFKALQQDRQQKQLNWMSEFSLKEKDYSLRERKTNLAESKQNGSTKGGTATIADLGVPSEQQKIGGWQKVTDEFVNTQDQINKNMNEYVYGVLSKVGHADDYFTVDYNNNNIPVPKNPKYIQDLYKQIKDSYKQSGYVNITASGKNLGTVKIDQEDLDYFDSVNDIEENHDLLRQKINRGEQASQQFLANNPEVKSISEDLERLNKQPIQVGGGITGFMGNPLNRTSLSINGNDVKNYVQFRKEWNNFSTFGTGHTDEEQEQKRNGLLRKYNLDLNKLSYLQNSEGGANPINSLITSIRSVPKTQEDFLNDYVSAGNNLYRPQAVGLFTTDKKYNEDIRHKVINLASSKGIETKDITANLEKINVSYTQDPVTKEYKVLIQNPKDNTTTEVPLSNADAANLQLQDLYSQDPVAQRLAYNSDKTGISNTGNPEKGGMTFDNAFHTGVVLDKETPKATELRYHVLKNKNGFYIKLYGRDKQGNTSLIKTFTPKQDWQSAKNDLLNIVKKYAPSSGTNQSPSYIYDPTIENRTNENLTQESSETEETNIDQQSTETEE